MSATSSHENGGPINCSKFYTEWKGHPIQDLTTFRSVTLEARPDQPIIYLAGDSSLDNKYWVNTSNQEKTVPDIYKRTLDRPAPKPDVSFWMNHFLGNQATCINTAIEESMLRERDKELLPHDAFIRDNLRAEDALIISVGANDVALKPTPCTIRHMLQLAWLTSRASIKDRSASSLKYFKHMFGTKLQNYIERLTAKTKPLVVIVCMIYFPLEADLGQKSWADTHLKALGYNSNPEQLQTAIRAMNDIATKQIEVEGTRVVPCALYEVLDGKTAGDYIERVEPSEEGGRKMATKFLELLNGVWPTKHDTQRAM
ncbi:hypothetical protein ACN47E_009373 [Coniothyrium glycines]